MTISYEDFSKVEMRVGRIISVEGNIPGAKKKYYRLKIDFGPEIGIKQSAAQITDRYTMEELKGRLVLGVTNFPVRKIVDYMSEVLTLGVSDEKGQVVLIKPDVDVPLGVRLA